ncbi:MULTISPECIES: hypothetical protein [Idiomarinaceae]|uniref:Uncharacterized protein n=1 Tax=Pseudidiomarina fusca TaxID=2965078 RepID=A0ABU3KT07_9GAMM|nr:MULTISPECIES: hypothetical protein [Idiomarinaceae]MDX1525422.1 hypothetical protein [Pseudidiomarina maritima]MDT7524595.1 hypothetical protein [Pseudidiomarina sp. GXY010]MRJ42714.1 hypothetical protein [Idiomarina sp. FeN1]NCU58278.1 hypothetical protein [Idiomarina sp. FenA--70]NCU60976.1 hypothetical protein [Idiomarina sp. FenBw--71]
MSTTEDNIEQSPLTQTYSANEQTVTIDIYKGESGWILEIVDAGNNSTLWEDEFATDQEALDEALAALSEEGIDCFIGPA